jgi:Ca2+-binding RTX toxin-like protein
LITALYTANRDAVKDLMTAPRESLSLVHKQKRKLIRKSSDADGVDKGTHNVFGAAAGTAIQKGEAMELLLDLIWSYTSAITGVFGWAGTNTYVLTCGAGLIRRRN